MAQRQVPQNSCLHVNDMLSHVECADISSPTKPCTAGDAKQYFMQARCRCACSQGLPLTNVWLKQLKQLAINEQRAV